MPIDDETLENAPLYHPGEDSDEIEYLRSRREALGGYLPSRRSPQVDIKAPEESTFSEFDEGTREGQLVSTTMVFVRLLRKLLKSDMGPRVVPIIPDEGRTFGMDPLFSEFGIFSQFGQNYTPVDHKMLMNYKESESGQIIQEGIAEATSMATWTAAWQHPTLTPIPPLFRSTSSTPCLDFRELQIRYGPPRDSRARGFLMGATAGRTTLNGEGLQHQDGHSLLMASAVPGCRAWDPAYAYELATIIRHGIDEMWGENMDVIHYVMLYNENQQQPPKPEGADHGIIKGAYMVQESDSDDSPDVRILGSGPILQYALEATSLLLSEHGVSSEVWSVTSYGELRREGLDSERHNRLNPQNEISSYVAECFGDNTPTIAVSDYIAAIPEMIQRWVGGTFTVLGTDGFGRSDTRENLRRFFEIDTESIIIASLSALERAGRDANRYSQRDIKKNGHQPQKRGQGGVILGRIRSTFKLLSWLWRNKIFIATIGSLIAKLRRKSRFIIPDSGCSGHNYSLKPP